MKATPIDYCDPGVTSLMTLAEWCEQAGIEAVHGPHEMLIVDCSRELPRRWYDQLWNLSDRQVCGVSGCRVYLLPDDGNRAPGKDQA